MTAPTSRESDKFVVRLPDGMRDRIRAAAAANNRSMNAEIVARLEKSFEEARVSPVAEALFETEQKAIRRKLDEISRVLADLARQES